MKLDSQEARVRVETWIANAQEELRKKDERIEELVRENAELRRRLERMAEVNACLKELLDRERKEANGK